MLPSDTGRGFESAVLPLRDAWASRWLCAWFRDWNALGTPTRSLFAHQAKDLSLMRENQSSGKAEAGSKERGPTDEDRGALPGRGLSSPDSGHGDMSRLDGEWIMREVNILIARAVSTETIWVTDGYRTRAST